MRRRWAYGLVVAAIVCSVALAYSCDPANEGPGCGPDSCSGCCLDGACVAGDTPETCGQGGMACFLCETGQECVAGACVAPAVCGNGSVEAGEECDDGNLSNGDGCDASCRAEAADADADGDADVADVVDTPETEECLPYPDGPYDFLNVGDVVGPMTWSAARSGPAEELAADLRAIRCSPGNRSIFLMVATTICPNCPTRLAEINRLKTRFEELGAKWVFLVTDASTPPMASLYIDRYGIDFGWRSNDQDNSLGRYAVAEATEWVPWIAAVRSRDMVVRFMETTTTRLDLETVAETLAAE